MQFATSVGKPRPLSYVSSEGQFNYCSGCSHVLSAIIQAKTRMNTRDFAEKELFRPSGITDVRWDADAQGIPIGGWGLQITPRDMAKLGYLYLRDGVWEGRQIVSSAWVKAATEKHTPTDGPLGYGYQWWTYPRWGAYAALGLVLNTPKREGERHASDMWRSPLCIGVVVTT